MFSIITPTYNREKLLGRVLESIMNQTFKEFEWIIIDDASTDETETLVQQWLLTYKSIDITYIKLDVNQGKSQAVNKGISLCKYSYTIIADSDDTFDSNTLNDLKSIWHEKIIGQNKNNIAAIWTLVKNEDGKIVGDKFPSDYWQVDFNTRVIKNTIEGEKWHCWKTKVLQEYPMYTSGDCYVQESTNWNRINKRFDFLCVNISHRVYFHTEDGIMSKPKPRREIAKIEYLSSYFALKDVSIKDLLRLKHYRDYSFNYIKTGLIYKNKELKLDLKRHLISLFIFITKAPFRAINKVR